MDPRHPLSRLLQQLRGWPLRLALALGLLAAAGATWLVWPYLASGGDIRAGLEHRPSRLWARPLVLRPGVAAGPRVTTAELELAGYRPADGPGEPALGRYRRDGRTLAARLRPRVTPAGGAPEALLEVRFTADGRVSELFLDGRPARQVVLEPALLASYYGEGVREVWPVSLAELPPHVPAAVVAAEDGGYWRHLGISPTGIARALLVNLRSGEVEQGGSTITQQLVKNLYLTSRRTLGRKAREAVLALAVELQHSKKDILQAYLNHIYLGTGHGVNYHGIGSASRAYFGRDPRELTLAEAATIAGIIHSPGDYLRDPEAALARRNEVLGRMQALELADPAAVAAAVASPLGLDPQPVGRRQAPYFAGLAAAEAAERFGLRRLGDQGYQLFSTLSLRDQRRAEAAVREGLARLEGPGNGHPLQAALVSVEPRSGEIRAYVGGRDYESSEFDRVRLARRQAGSAFKPVIVAAALEGRAASPATLLDDSPLLVHLGRRTWEPRNDDGRFRGQMTLRQAVADSRNVPLVRLALATGLPQVEAMARRLGIAGDLEAVPSLALGAFEVTPLEMATVYSTFATIGERPRLHGLVAVRDADGGLVEDAAPPASERVVDPHVAYLTTSILRDVVDRGTGRGARRYNVTGALAGKTGTSNGARDSWFAGYRPDRVTVVWVGYDQPEETRFSGARAALPIWGSFCEAALPPAAGLEFPEPPGLLHATVCSVSGLAPTPLCPTYEELFLPGQGPGGRCTVHRRDPWEAWRERRGDDGIGSWLERRLRELFGD